MPCSLDFWSLLCVHIPPALWCPELGSARQCPGAKLEHSRRTEHGCQGGRQGNFSLGHDACIFFAVCRSSSAMFWSCCVFPSYPAQFQQQSYAVEPPSSVTEVTNENIDAAAGKTALIWPCRLPVTALWVWFYK